MSDFANRLDRALRSIRENEEPRDVKKGLLEVLANIIRAATSGKPSRHLSDMLGHTFSDFALKYKATREMGNLSTYISRGLTQQMTKDSQQDVLERAHLLVQLVGGVQDAAPSMFQDDDEEDV